MKLQAAVKALVALGHENRLRIFRLLLKKGKKGLSVGEIGEKVGISGATLSFHLSQLHQAKLVDSRKEGRAVIYTIKNARMKKLLELLLDKYSKFDKEMLVKSEKGAEFNNEK